jgi:uncharacterized protein (TIGR01777 family)
MRVVVTGATGLIGREVVEALIQRGDSVVALSRDRASAREKLNPAADLIEWADPLSDPAPELALAGADAVIHLLGEPVSQRWTPSARTAINNSRVLGTRNLVAGLRATPEAQRPKVLVSQSATGYYGPHGSELVDETTAPGDDFLAQVVIAWETEARAAEEFCRVVYTRTGVVLAPQGGALEKMLPIFKLGAGGPVGGGGQYVPWIHVDDVVGALLAAVDDASLSGPVNLTAPRPVTNKELSHALGKALHRPAFWPVPGLAVKLLYGGMSALVLTGQKAVPERLEDVSYQFRYPELQPALDAVVRQL